MAVKMHRKLIPLVVFVLATTTQGGYLHSPSSHTHTNHGYSSYSPQNHYASSHGQYTPTQFQTAVYTSHAPVSQSYVASQPALLSQPAYTSQGQYTPSHYSSPQYSPQSAYQYSLAPAVAAPVRQTIVSQSQTQPAFYANQVPSQYASSANAYVTQNAAAASSVSYGASHGGLTSQSLSYPASTSYVTSQTSHSGYPASQAAHVNLPAISQTYGISQSAPTIQPSVATVSASLPTQSAQYSSISQSYSSQNSQPEQSITLTVPQNDNNYLRQYKQGDYHYQTGSAPLTTSAVQQNSQQNHQVIRQNYQSDSASPITTTVVQHNGDHHHVTSSNNNGGYHYQGGISSAAPVSTTVVLHNSGQHQVTSSNNGYSYQAASSAASAPGSATVIQQSGNQHVTSGSNGYHYVAGSSSAAPVSTSLVHHQSGHHAGGGNSNSGGYQYQTGFQPIPTTVVHHNGNHHEVSGYSSHEDSSNTGTHQSGGVNLEESYNPVYSQAYSAPTPIITKHIYFHAPPAEVDERPIHSVPVSPPKKTYNIVFIKVPSQERRHGSTLQSLASAPQQPIEDKTLIYVLVKKPEPQQISVQQKSPKVNSQHEVFYVKYKGNVGEVAHQINEKLSQQGALQEAQLQQSSVGYQQGSVVSGPLISLQEPLQVVHQGSAYGSSSQSNVVIERQQLTSVDAGVQSSQPIHVTLPGLPNGHHQVI